MNAVASLVLRGYSSFKSIAVHLYLYVLSCMCMCELRVYSRYAFGCTHVWTRGQSRVVPQELSTLSYLGDTVFLWDPGLEN